MTGRRRTILLVVVGFAVLTAAALLFTRTETFERWCARYVSSVLGDLGMQVESVRVELWPDAAVDLVDLTIRDPGSEDEAGRARSISVAFPLWPLLAGNVEFDAVRVEKARLEVERDADGSFRRGGAIAALLPRVEAMIRDEQVHLRTLDVVDSSVVLSDALAPGGPLRARLGGIEMHLERSTGGAGGWQVEVRAGTGTIASPTARVGAPFALDAKASTDGDSLEVAEAHFEAQEVGVAQLQASEASADFRYDAKGLVLDPLRFRAYGGKWEQRGTLSDDEGAPRFDGSIRIEEAKVRELSADLLARPATPGFETLSGDAKLAGAWRNGRVEDVEASGRIRLAGGTLPSSSILTAIWRAVIPGASVLAPLEQTTALDHLSMSFTAADRQLRTDDLELVSSDYTFSGGGTIGLDTSLALDGNVRLTAKGLEKLVLMTSLPLPTGALPSLPPIPTQIRGTLEDPKVRPNVSGLPRAPLEALFSGVSGGVESLGSAVGGAARALERGAEKALPIR